jgi:hypothetical protein
LLASKESMMRSVDVGVTGRTPVLIVLAAFAAATVYEVLVAVNEIHLGELPGEGPPGAEPVGLVAAAAVAASAVVVVILAARGNEGTSLAAALSPAAAAFMIAHFYAYDPYYLPTLIRQSEKDYVPPLVVYVFAALSVGVGLVTLSKRAAGLALTVPAVLLCGLTAWFSGGGH